MKLQRPYINTAILIVAVTAILSLYACAPKRDGVKPTGNPNITQSDDDALSKKGASSWFSLRALPTNRLIDRFGRVHSNRLS